MPILSASTIIGLLEALNHRFRELKVISITSRFNHPEFGMYIWDV
jgi:hypothetical protein